MKKLTLNLLALFLITVASVSAAVPITGFGTTDFSAGFSDFTTTTPTTNNVQIIGNDSNIFFGSILPSSVNITGNTAQLQLTGTFTGTATSGFDFELFDSGSGSLLYHFNYASFTVGVPMTVTANLQSTSGVFNGLVASIGFSGSGLGSSTVNFTLDNLVAGVAVPEPSTYALLALGVVGLVAYRRRLA
jgi:hypothetical protein